MVDPNTGCLDIHRDRIMAEPEFWFRATWHRVGSSNHASALSQWLVRLPIFKELDAVKEPEAHA